MVVVTVVLEGIVVRLVGAVNVDWSTDNTGLWVPLVVLVLVEVTVLVLVHWEAIGAYWWWNVVVWKIGIELVELSLALILVGEL